MSKHIVIAGAGIGGLSAALAMANQGYSVTVCEQTDEIKEVGAGLQLSPNAMHVMNALGVSTRLENLAFRPQHAVMRHYKSGASYFSVPLGDACLQRYGAEYWHVHRADLLQSLLASCEGQSIEIKLATAVIGYEQYANQSVRVLLQNGAQIQADVLIGADGIHSNIQAHLLNQHNESSHPQFTGQVAWRGTVKTKDLPPHLVEPNANLWVGPGKHFVSYYLRGGELVNFVAVEERSEWQEESWSQEGNITQLRELFSAWHPQVTEVLEASKTCFVWALHDRKPLTTWVDKNVALLGDACHPMLPFLAQGAAMAIEDAYVLAKMLASHDNSQQALLAYQSDRIKRTSHIQLKARKNAGLYHMHAWQDRSKLNILNCLSAVGASTWLAAKQLDKIYAYSPL